MKIALIVAASENGVIGRDNQLPWRLPTDLKRFKALTMGKPMVMGRKTFQSIGKALPGRANIVVTRDEGFSADGIDVAHSLEAALDLARAWAEGRDGGDLKDVTHQASEIAVIGGANIYRQALPLASIVHMTVVHDEIEGDAFFPRLDPERWEKTEAVAVPRGEKDSHVISYETYRRVSPG